MSFVETKHRSIWTDGRDHNAQSRLRSATVGLVDLSRIQRLAQWTSGVRRTEAKSQLPQTIGVLIAGECYLEETSYKLTQSGVTWRLSKMTRVPGDEYVVVVRDFIKVEPPVSKGGALPQRDSAKVTYELYWPASQQRHQGRALTAASYRPHGTDLCSTYQVLTDSE